MKLKNHRILVLLSFVLLGIFSVSLNSCDNDENVMSQVEKMKTEKNTYIYCSITADEYNAVFNKVRNTINHSTRALGNEFTEAEAQVVLQPFIDDGISIQKQLISNKDELSLTIDDVESLNGMTDDQLAEMSFVLNSMCNGALAQNVSFEDVVGCLAYAAGIDDMRDVISMIGGGYRDTLPAGYYTGTKMLMTAKTTKQLVKAFAKRTVGIVSIAWMMYDFGDCISKK